ncbi:MAG TPA: hypothetical protein VFS77_22700 [Pyrinomonadaceae bacterium]|nr:hypothetical protein [Pyrinomonadaceae bacterium]
MSRALSIIAGLSYPSAADAQTQPQGVYSQFDPIVIDAWSIFDLVES